MLPKIAANESGATNSYALLQVQGVAAMVEIKSTEAHYCEFSMAAPSHISVWLILALIRIRKRYVEIV